MKEREKLRMTSSVDAWGHGQQKDGDHFGLGRMRNSVLATG